MKRFFGVAVIWSVLGLLGFALAQAPTAAGVVITNQATATYTNAANQPLTAESNTVTTEVQPIYRFEILPNGADTAGATGQQQTGAVGDEVVFTYTLENQGNTSVTVNLSAIDSTTDSNSAGGNLNFGAKTIYAETDGVPGFSAGDTPVPAAGLVVPYNTTPVTLYVVTTVPAGVTDDDSVRLNLSGTAAQDSTQVDNNNWAELAAFTNANLSVNKSASATNVNPGGTVTYTVSGSNDGGTSPFAVDNIATIDGTPSDGILVSDDFDNALTYTSGTLALSGTNTTGTGQLLYSVNDGATWTTTQPASGVNAVALFIPGTVGQRVTTTAEFNYGFTFDVTVPTGVSVTAGTEYDNSARVRYDSNGNGDSADTDPFDEDKTSNTTTTAVDLVQAFTFETDEAQTTSSTVPVVYTHTITNGSNSDALVDLSFSGGTTGWTYEYSLTGLDGSYNTTLPQDIPVAAGATQQVYVRVTPAAGAVDPDTFTLTATPTYGTVVGTPDSVTDTTTIDEEFFGELKLTKTVSVNGGTPGTDNEAEPGDTLTYTIVGENIGTGGVNNVQITDAVPANTTYVANTLSATTTVPGGTVVYSLTGADGSWSTAPVTPSTTTGTFYVGVNTASANDTIDDADVIPADDTVTITFDVTIN